MPAARLYFALSLATLLLVGAIGQPRLLWWVLALDLLLVGAFLLDLRRARRIALDAKRHWPTTLVQGAPDTVTVEIANRSRRPLTVWLREGLSPALAAQPCRVRLQLAGGQRWRWSYPLTPRRRGEATAAALTARLLGPWRLAWTQRELLAPALVRVFPQIRWEGRVGHLLTLARRQQLGTTPLSVRGLGSEPYALREYLAGDPPNKIHWKATARHGRMVTREDTWERGARLLILLDAARSMTSREGDRSKLDHALASSLALARVAAARGDRVTVLAFSDRIERQVRIGGGGPGRDISRAYLELYDLQARLAEPAYDLAAERALALESRSATVVLMTSVVDLAAAELLRESLLHLERRHRPILVNLRDPELEALAVDRPQSAEAAFAQVAGLEILLANRRLGTHLRRAGIRVVSTPADRLALETIEAYLAIFRARAGDRRPAA
jgi:uncharacterized protein (DUF58 family)